VAPPGYQEGAGGAGLNHANGCYQHTYSPGSFAGQTVTLKFTGTGPDQSSVWLFGPARLALVDEG